MTLVVAGSIQARPVGKVALVSAQASYSYIYPSLQALLATDSLASLFSTVGQLGSMNPLPRYIGYPHPDSVWTGLGAPPYTNIDYLSWHDMLIGGIVRQDTLVSSGTTAGGGDFYPTSFSRDRLAGNIMPFDGLADQSYWMQFADTAVPGLTRPPDWGKPFVPLNIVISDRIYGWQSGLPARSLIHDYVITNVGNDTIRELYIGAYLDPDLCTADDSDRTGIADDLAGSFPQNGLCYVIDNNGEPRDGAFPREMSPSRATGFKLLASSSPVRDTGFNWTVVWWDGQASARFTPRRRGNTTILAMPRDDISLGHADTYNSLRTKGWDYDQVLTGTIGQTDLVWQYPGDTAWCHYGADVSVVYSFGPFDLPPDSSVRYLVSTFVSSQVHHDPYIFDFLRYAPELYNANLDLSGLFASAQVADSLAEFLIDPQNAPTGLRLLSIGSDSATVEWDPWGFDNCDGTNLYLMEIPPEAYQRQGVVPPWLDPSELPEPIVLGRERQHTFRGLSPYKAYACFAANRIGTEHARLSSPVTFKLPTPVAAPIPASSHCYFVSGRPASFEWTSPDTLPVSGYRIYRFPDSLAELAKSAPFYSINKLDEPVVDSIQAGKLTYYLYAPPVYATVDASARSFTDSAACDSCVYVITTIDTAGFESAFSAPIYTKRVLPKSRDILVLTCAGGVYTFVTCDTIRAFFQSILGGYTFDIFHLADSVLNSDCATRSPFCFDWVDFTKYRLVVIDDAIRDAVLTSNYEGTQLGFTHYLQSGGRLACFGSLAAAGATLGPTLQPGPYSRSLPFVRNLLGIDSVLFMGTFYYRFNTSAPYVDSLLGFAQAEAVTSDIPSVSFDSLRYPFTGDLATHWPVGTPPSATAFVPNGHGHVTHLFRSRYPESSFTEGKPAGLMAVTNGEVAFTFGFHLWYMNQFKARQLIDWIMQQVPTGIDSTAVPVLPSRFALSQNYPNPFNASTKITFELPSADEISLEIYNIAGQEVRTVFAGHLNAGIHTVSWDGRSDAGKEVASGVYLYRLRGREASMSRKMLLLK